MIILKWLPAAVLLSAGIIYAANGLYWLVKSLRSRKWPAVPGKIVTSEVATETEIECGTFGDPVVITRDIPKIRYSYAVGGREFKSGRIRWITRKWGTTDPARKTVAKYRSISPFPSTTTRTTLPMRCLSRSLKACSCAVCSRWPS